MLILIRVTLLIFWWNCMQHQGARLCAVMPGAMQLQRGGGHTSNKFGLVTIPLATVAIFTDNVSKGHY